MTNPNIAQESQRQKFNHARAALTTLGMAVGLPAVYLTVWYLYRHFGDVLVTVMVTAVGVLGVAILVAVYRTAGRAELGNAGTEGDKW